MYGQLTKMIFTNKATNCKVDVHECLIFELDLTDSTDEQEVSKETLEKAFKFIGKTIPLTSSDYFQLCNYYRFT